MGIVRAVISRLKKSFVARFHLALENVALHQQLEVLRRSAKRPKLRQRDRIFWVLLWAIWPDWRSALMIVKSEAVLGWANVSEHAGSRRSTRRKLHVMPLERNRRFGKPIEVRRLGRSAIATKH